MDFYILHGWSISNQNRQKWQPFLNLLKKAGFSVHFLEIPGLSTPLDESWYLQDFVDWLEKELHGQKNVALLGHSFGGQLSIRYTALHPQQISRLILVDSSGIRDKRLRARFKRKVFFILAKTGKNFLKAPIFRTILYKMARETDYKKAPPAQRKSMANVLQDEILEDLPQITCPTQIIWGADDTTTPLRNAHLLHEAIVGSTLDVIEGARHSPQFTHPEQVVKTIQNFLKRDAEKHDQ